ncbi:hypothetical protein RvY_05564 [Ramazzottius varieornatus]|uniref:Uncharacterized protein n=1 Tax=Ramazzottius varieornatus TaxID=947166 RepID=A0A1D1V127_RAMVA|nr:hypothetical protein RvY_05564 [Ramazzottius varieornatus]
MVVSSRKHSSGSSRFTWRFPLLWKPRKQITWFQVSSYLLFCTFFIKNSMNFIGSSGTISSLLNL